MCHRRPGRSLRPPSPLLLLLPLLLQPPWTAAASAKRNPAGEQNGAAADLGASPCTPPTQPRGSPGSQHVCIYGHLGSHFLVGSLAG